MYTLATCVYVINKIRQLKINRLALPSQELGRFEGVIRTALKAVI
jgi:hypothetical protein